MTDKMKELLEDQHEFPGPFLFKFIVPGEKKTDLLAVMPAGEHSEKPSRNGKYVSVTVKAQVASADDVLKIFEGAQKIEGVIAL